MTVASIICRAASHSPLPASASRITSQTPLSAHRRNCRKIEFQLPNSSGRSRHGAPVRINQNTASSTRRWLCGGRPPRRIRKGSKYAHSSSVISPRIKAALPQRAALNQFTIPASTDLSTRPSLVPQKRFEDRRITVQGAGGGTVSRNPSAVRFGGPPGSVRGDYKSRDCLLAGIRMGTMT